MFDLVESLIVSSYGGPQDAEQRDIRTAVQRAYSEVTTINEWSHYYTHGRVITQPQYQTGTVAFNASNNQLTLSGGSWPEWATSGSVAIGRLIAKVAAKESSTVLTLDPTLTFPSNYSAGQAYVLYQTDYALPADFRNMDDARGTGRSSRTRMDRGTSSSSLDIRPLRKPWTSPTAVTRGRCGGAAMSLRQGLRSSLTPGAGCGCTRPMARSRPAWSALCFA